MNQQKSPYYIRMKSELAVPLDIGAILLRHEISVETLGRLEGRRYTEGCATICKKSEKGNDTSFEVPRTDGIHRNDHQEGWKNTSHTLTSGEEKFLRKKAPGVRCFYGACVYSAFPRLVGR